MQHVIINKKQKEQIAGIFKINNIYILEFYNKDTEFCETENEVYDILEKIKTN